MVLSDIKLLLLDFAPSCRPTSTRNQPLKKILDRALKSQVIFWGDYSADPYSNFLKNSINGLLGKTGQFSDFGYFNI